MLESRRRVLDTLREGPALFTGLPGDEVDLDHLAAHMVDRGIDGGIYATDGSLEGLLWIQQGSPGETWFFEAGGQEAVLPVTTSRDLLLDIAARGGTISVFVGAQLDLLPPFGGPPEPLLFSSGPMTVHESPGPPGAAAHAREAASFFEDLLHTSDVDERFTVDAAPAPPAHDARETASHEARDAEAVGPPFGHGLRLPEPAALEPKAPAPEAPAELDHFLAAGPAALLDAPPGAAPASAESELSDDAGVAHDVSMEPPARPWPAILSDFAARVVRHRGPKLAAKFTTALEHALEPHGGRIEGTRVVAPPLSESTWREVVEAGCAPVTAVAGRAFVDRTIAAAERAVEAEQDRE
jgi:hypothetical protein